MEPDKVCLIDYCPFLRGSFFRFHVTLGECKGRKADYLGLPNAPDLEGLGTCNWAKTTYKPTMT